jgi:hypothetical protein
MQKLFLITLFGVEIIERDGYCLTTPINGALVLNAFIFCFLK